jgi:hypothetical protein
MQVWADVLAEKFRESGGELILGSYVEKILTRNGTAVGIRTMGTEYTADCIISACDYKQTFLKLLDRNDIPADFLNRVQNARVSEGIFAVYLGLKKNNASLLADMKNSYVLYANPEVEVDVFDQDDPDFFEKTSLGIAMRACAENPLGASLMGISVQKASLFAWAWGSGIGALAGIAVAPLLFIQYTGGLMPMIKGFIAMSIGGLSSIVGSVIAGFLLGIIESYTIGLISSKFSDTIVFALLMVVLIIKPSGLFGK